MGTYKKLHTLVTAAEHTITGKRWCGHCQLSRTVDGGKWIVSNNGRNRRWKCQSCCDQAKARAAAALVGELTQ